MQLRLHYCECAGTSWPLEWRLQPQFPEPEEFRSALALAAYEFGSDEKDWVRQVPRVKLELIAQYVESNTGIPARAY